jgi:hypothetical protein
MSKLAYFGEHHPFFLFFSLFSRCFQISLISISYQKVFCYLGVPLRKTGIIADVRRVQLPDDFVARLQFPYVIRRYDCLFSFASVCDCPHGTVVCF